MATGPLDRGSKTDSGDDGQGDEQAPPSNPAGMPDRLALTLNFLENPSVENAQKLGTAIDAEDQRSASDAAENERLLFGVDYGLGDVHVPEGFVPDQDSPVVATVQVVAWTDWATVPGRHFPGQDRVLRVPEGNVLTYWTPTGERIEPDAEGRVVVPDHVTHLETRRPEDGPPPPTMRMFRADQQPPEGS